MTNFCRNTSLRGQLQPDQVLLYDDDENDDDENDDDENDDDDGENDNDDDLGLNKGDVNSCKKCFKNGHISKTNFEDFHVRILKLTK